MLHMPSPMLLGGNQPPPVANTLLDFVNGVYRVDSTTYATAALAGFTGAGTFDAEGYTPTGTNALTKTLTLAGNFLVVATFVQPASDVFRRLWQHPASVSTGQVYRLAGGNYGTGGPAGAATVQVASATRIAFGWQSSAYKSCFDGGAVNVGGGTAPSNTGAFTIGNNGETGGTAPWAAPIKKLEIYNQALTDGQIQAAGA